MEFLGITTDTVSQELYLPVAKLEGLSTLIAQWQHQKSCTKRKLVHCPLESLLGVIQHACVVIPVRRTFVRHIISLLSVTKQRHHLIHLNNIFRSDLAWWQGFTTWYSTNPRCSQTSKVQYLRFMGVWSFVMLIGFRWHGTVA